MNKNILLLVVGALLGAALSHIVAGQKNQTVQSAHVQNATEENTDAPKLGVDAVKEQLKIASPRLADVEVEETAVNNVYRFWIANEMNHVYYSEDHLLIGDMMDLKRRVSLGNEAQDQRLVQMLESAAGKSIDYGPKDAQKVLNIFTDIDCPYCQRLHAELGELTSRGVKVSYYAFPRTGIDTDSYDKYVSVWCSEDQLAAMNLAKSGQRPVAKTCENPVADTYNLGIELGLTGTPTMYYDDGNSLTVVPGYRPAKVLISELNL